MPSTTARVMELHNARSSFVHRLAMGALFAVLAIGGFCGSAGAVEVMTATGYQHSAYLADDGTVWCWGENDFGQLGNNSTTDSNVPTQVRIGVGATQLLTDVIAIAAGYQHTFALRADGTVWSWGRNDSWGALGLGSTASSFLFANQIPGLSGIKAIASGGFTGYALSAYGSLLAWGYNGLGSVGDTTTTSRISPVSLSITNVREISAGLYHAVAVLTNGTVNSWGYDSDGQLGNGVANDGSYSASPVVVTGLVNALHVACGNTHTLVTRSNGQIAAWGLNTSGQLGNSSAVSFSNVPVNYFSNSRRVFASGDHSMSQQVWGGFFICGKNDVGQCAQSSALSYNFMSNIGSYVRGASGFGDHSLIIGGNGQVWACGNNVSGQLGGGSTGGSTSVLTLVTAKWPVSHIVGLSTGTFTTHAVKSEGSLYGWGYNSNGQVGDGGTSIQTAAVPVSLSNVLKTASGQIGYHTLALTWDGSVYAWGSNSQGQLGNGAISSSATSSPAIVSGVFSMRDIAAGGAHSLAIDNTGSVYAWGDDSSGQVGDDAIFDNFEANPRVVYESTGLALTNVIAIAAGHEHSLALRADGTVWSWGNNFNGQLGNGGFVSQARAVQVPGLTNITAIGAGYLSSYAIKADGQVMGWGDNGYGQLGNGNTTTQTSPVNARTSIFAQLKGATSVSGGIYHTIANRPGQVLGWGYNVYGQLGNSSNTDLSYATGVTGLTTAARVVAGSYYSHALLADGSVRSWGYNDLGSLGTGDYTTTNVAVAAQPDWLPTANLAVTDADAGESGPNAGAFQVTRTGSTAGVLVVGYATAGTASEGSDYTTLSGSVNIPAGQVSATVALTPIDDNEDEVDEIESTTPTITTTLAANQYLTGTASGVINITDNDVAGVIFPAVAGLSNESDGNTFARLFTVRLSSRPTAPVTLTFASSNPDEAAVDTNTSAGNQNQTSVTFTSAEWNLAKTVHVLGQQDTFDDGDITYSIQTTAVTSTDSKYNGLGVADQSWTNFDDDTAGIVVSAISGLVTEAGGVATFTIRLASEPYDRVDFTLSSNDTSEYQLQSGSEVATLDSSNWSSGVTITVVGMDDSIDDGNVAFNVQIAKSVSNDPAYNNRGGWDVAGTCTDDDAKGVVLSTTSVSSDEDGTPTGTFTVRLASQPIGTGTVTITFAGDTQAAVDTDAATAGNQTTVSFSSSTWSTPRTVSVPAIDDNLIEATQTGTITGVVTGASTDYASGVTVTVASVTCTIGDNDAAGFTLSPSTTAASRQNTSEPGVTANFTVRLTSQPASGKTVTVRLRSNDVSEGQLSTTAIVRTSISTTGGTDTINFAGGTDLSVVAVGDRVWITGAGNNNDTQGNVLSVNDATDSIVLTADLQTEGGAQTITIYPRLALTFTNATWATLQTVTVTGQDDAVTDTPAEQNYQIDFEIDTAVAAHDANYIATLAPTQWMKNLDNDTSGLQILQSLGSTVLTEANVAATDSFSVQLTTSPTSPVTVTITAGSQFSVDRTALFFTDANFSVAQTVTATVVDDQIDEASPHSANITFATSSGQAAYDLLAIDPIVVAITDNDTAGITVIPTTGLATTEGGGTASFSISLASQPIASVELGIASSNTNEGTVSASTLTFTTANWFQPQSVVITGIDDPVDDDLTAYTIVTSACLLYTSPSPRD